MICAGVTSSTLSMMDPNRPTMRPFRTLSTCTETSRSSLSVAIRSKCSGRSVTTSWRATARRTSRIWSLIRAARSYSSISEASSIRRSSRDTSSVALPVRTCASPSTYSR